MPLVGSRCLLCGKHPNFGFRWFTYGSRYLLWVRAVPISLFADYTDTTCSRLLKQPIPTMDYEADFERPIMRGYYEQKFLNYLSKFQILVANHKWYTKRPSFTISNGKVCLFPKKQFMKLWYLVSAVPVIPTDTD